MTQNVINAVFKEGDRLVYTKRIHQHDKGVILRISGIALPETYKAQFANDPHDGIGAAKTVSGSDILIPDVYLRTGKYIYVWVYFMRDPASGAGQTEYQIIIPVEPRPEVLDIAGSSGDIVATLDEEDHALVFEYR